MAGRPVRTALARQLLGRLENAYRAAADPDRAPDMAAYMRGQFAFLGIPTPLRRSLDREVVAGLPRPNAGELAEIAAACWEMSEREFQYFATDYLGRHVGVVPAGFIEHAQALVVTKSWWDTVDALAVRLVGPMVTAHPPLVETMDAWLEADDLWLIRTAVLHQLLYHGTTDPERLWRYSLRRADHPDFFIRKAIGWSLREYSKTDAVAVVEFVDRYAEVLSPLSRREALKWLRHTGVLEK